MTWLDRVRAWLGQEKAELDDVRRGLEADLDRRERQLQETPEQRLSRLQGEMKANDDAFEEVRRKAEGRQAAADATADLSQPGGEADNQQPEAKP